MIIGIIGLGLIGGSLAKAIKHNTEHTILGTDIVSSVLLKAKALGAIDEELTTESISTCDIVILALYPKTAVEYVKQNSKNFKNGAIVLDCCGVKIEVCTPLFDVAKENDFIFVGGHPMAGMQFSGFAYSKVNLFNNASMIFTPAPNTDIITLHTLKTLFMCLGFTNIEITTPIEHDKLIAYTSQLAHVVSNAYVKSPSALHHSGFSAGSYNDLTRVAWLDENMWTELFSLNKDNLIFEIDSLIGQLQKYSIALKGSDTESLKALLKEGKDRKALIDGKEVIL